MAEFRKKLNGLYNGTSKKSVRFRFGLIAFDTVTISFFIVTSMVELSVWILCPCHLYLVKRNRGETR